MPKAPSGIIRMYRVRVDGNNDEVLINFCKTYSANRYLLVHHITQTDNPHYHFYAESSLTQGNFSNKIKAVMQVQGGDYSNKSCDSDRRLSYLSYLFNTKKGNKSRLVAYEGFSPLDVETFRESAKTIETEFETRMLQKKKTQYDIAIAVLERMDARQTVFPEVVYDVVIDTLKASHMMARPNHVKDIIATVMAYSDDKRSKDLIKQKTLKFFDVAYPG